MRTNAILSARMLALFLAGTATADQPAVTVYNQNFGVVRERLSLDLKPGLNTLEVTEITAHVEPDSVILRDPSGTHRIQVLEQNYRADPLSQALLLSLFEGREVDFLVADEPEPVRGRIVRSAYVPHRQAWQQYGQQYYYTQQARMSNPLTGGGQPIIEMNGKMRFGLPGTPLFPSLADDTILKPTMNWILETDAAGQVPVELSYVTGGMSWKADYNVLAVGEGNVLELIGWVTIDNQTGRTFADARIKLMAGDVSKIRPGGAGRLGGLRSMSVFDFSGSMAPPVSEKTFDEYHLYSLNRATTLRDRETKQVEFVRAAGVQSRRLYVYDGADIDWRRYQGWDPHSLRTNRELGTRSNPDIWVMRELENTKKNHLGMPLPAGRVRFYRQDDDGQLEFIGENEIDHTPKDETLRVYTGNAFDIVGERRRTDFATDHSDNWVDEAFEIKLRNHKKDPVEIRIIEHLYRWFNWEIKEKSHDFEKTESQTVEFRVTVPPDGEEKVSYRVHYTW